MAVYPKGLPKRLRWHWDHPWSWRARRNPRFRLWLGRNGYLTPHFTKREARCKDGTPVPRRLLVGARRHAFNLERLRHALGDKPVPIISWYRTDAYNRRVGGASKSQHVRAVATDHPVEWVSKHKDFDKTADRIFYSGGIGLYPGGNRHLDSRGWRARWTSW